MKEVTYEDWQKNPIPRMMWVWDNIESGRKKLKVLYILSKEESPASYPRVLALTNEYGRVVRHYEHCAEIEDPKTRQIYVYSFYDCIESRGDEEVQLYKKNGFVFIPTGITVEEVEKLKKENTELKTRGQCRNKYVCSDNGKSVPCYIYYDCLNCHHKTE